MNFLFKRRLVLVISSLLIISMISFHPVTANQDHNAQTNLGLNKISSQNSMSNVLAVEKRINTTEVHVGDVIVVEIILHNYRTSDVYNVTVNEEKILNPLINTSYLVSPLIFARIKAQEETTIAYTVTSSKAVNFTIGKTVVTYKISPNDNRIFTSYSIAYQLAFLPIDLSQVDFTNQYTLIYTIIIATYSAILLIRIFFKSRSVKQTS